MDEADDVKHGNGTDKDGIFTKTCNKLLWLAALQGFDVAVGSTHLFNMHKNQKLGTM